MDPEFKVLEHLLKRILQIDQKCGIDFFLFLLKMTHKKTGNAFLWGLLMTLFPETIGDFSRRLTRLPQEQTLSLKRVIRFALIALSSSSLAPAVANWFILLAGNQLSCSPSGSTALGITVSYLTKRGLQGKSSSVRHLITVSAICYASAYLGLWAKKNISQHLSQQKGLLGKRAHSVLPSPSSSKNSLAGAL